MPFSNGPHAIRWQLHLTAPIANVYHALSTDTGRASFWAETAHDLTDDDHGGTDLTVIDSGVPARDRAEVMAGWVSVLMNLKAVVDFGVDLRAHDTERHWETGYVEN